MNKYTKFIETTRHYCNYAEFLQGNLMVSVNANILCVNGSYTQFIIGLILLLGNGE